MSELTSRRPYLIRAIYDWVVDNGLTPHLLVAADAPGVDVPSQFVTEEGRITINVSPSAVRDLRLGNDAIQFAARFSGQPYQVMVPPGAVLALYARENGEGMLFGEVETPPEPPPSDGPSGEDESKKKRSHLKVVK